MTQIALINLAALCLLWYAQQGAQEDPQAVWEGEQRWLADVHAVEKLKAKGFVAIDQHEILIGGPMGPEWSN